MEWFRLCQYGQSDPSRYFSLLQQFYNTTCTVNTPGTHGAGARIRTESRTVKQSPSVDCTWGAPTAATKLVRANFETLLSVFNMHVLSSPSQFSWELGVETSISKWVPGYMVKEIIRKGADFSVFAVFTNYGKWISQNWALGLVYPGTQCNIFAPLAGVPRFPDLFWKCLLPFF